MSKSKRSPVAPASGTTLGPGASPKKKSVKKNHPVKNKKDKKTLPTTIPGTISERKLPDGGSITEIYVPDTPDVDELIKELKSLGPLSEKDEKAIRQSDLSAKNPQCNKLSEEQIQEIEEKYDATQYGYAAIAPRKVTPISLTVWNIAEETVDAVLFDPEFQNDNIIIRSGYSDVSYKEILRSLVAAPFTCGCIYLYINSPADKTFRMINGVVKTKDAKGMVVTIPICVKVAPNQMQKNILVDETIFRMDTLTYFTLSVPPNTRLTIFFYPEIVPEKK